MGGWNPVTARSNERKAILRDDPERRHFLEIVAEMVRRFRLRLHCFVLLDNHYSLLLELREEQVREPMRKLRAYRWSSYRWYIGLGAAPTWLECDTVLALGDGAKATVSGIRGNSGSGGIGAKPMGGDPGASRVGRGGVFGGLEEADSRGCPRANESAAVD